MTRSGASPAKASAGANRSGRVTHHSTRPRVRAAIPAAKSAAAAPSIAPLPPPATSCSAPSANPPSGKRSSMALTPNGNTARRCLSPPSRHRMRSRSAAITAMGTGVYMPCYNLLWGPHVPYLFSLRLGVNWCSIESNGGWQQLPEADFVLRELPLLRVIVCQRSGPCRLDDTLHPYTLGHNHSRCGSGCYPDGGCWLLKNLSSAA